MLSFDEESKLKPIAGLAAVLPPAPATSFVVAGAVSVVPSRERCSAGCGFLRGTVEEKWFFNSKAYVSQLVLFK